LAENTQNACGGRAPPGPTGELTAVFQNHSWTSAVGKGGAWEVKERERARENRVKGNGNAGMKKGGGEGRRLI